jgi:hypothetical protein
MGANKIVQIKTVRGGSPESPLIAILTNIDVKDAQTADRFLREVAETFMCHRLCSHPDPNAMLLTIIGDMSAGRCAELWRQFMREDEALNFIMSQMQKADVIRGTESGEVLEMVSIIDGYKVPDYKGQK